MRPTLLKSGAPGSAPQRRHCSAIAVMWLFHVVALSSGLTFCAAAATWAPSGASFARLLGCCLLLWMLFEGIGVGIAAFLATRACRADQLHGQRKLLWDACLLITLILCGSLPIVFLGVVLAGVSLIYVGVQLRPQPVSFHG